MDDRTRPAPIYVSVGIVTQLVRYLRHLQVDVDRLFRSQNIDPGILSSPDARIPIELYFSLEDEAAQLTQDPYFGLHIGELFEVGNWNILGFMMMNCRTLGEAFAKADRYSKIIGNLIQPSALLRYKKVKLVLSTPPNAPQMSRHCFESALASIIQLARSLSGQDISPMEVGFTSPLPDSTEEYTRVFRCPVHFQQKECYMLLDIRIGNIPVKLPNPDLLKYFEDYAQEYLSTVETQGTVTQEVLKQILLHLDGKSLTVAQVAKEMNISTRTLQMQLRHEGTDFSTLLQDTRLKLAIRHLKENRTVEDITYMLGFTDPSVFRKAFKNWTGYTPRQYREEYKSAQ